MNWPIKIITLDDSVARRAPLLGALERLELDYEPVRAVDGRQRLDSLWEKRIDRERAERHLGRRLTDAEFGCALSHLRIYEEIVETGLPGAIVLEDDAIVDRPFHHFVQERLYEQHDLIQLDYGQAFVFSFGIGRTRLSNQLATERLVCNASLTTGYSISRRASRYILHRAQPLSLPADWPCDLRPLRPVICVPRVVSHLPPGSGSYIEAARAAARRHANAGPDDRLPEAAKSPRPWWFRFARRLVTRSIARNP